jgi:Protein of unknwon function (DUF3310)
MSESKLYCGAEIVRDGVPSFCMNAPNACRWHKPKGWRTKKLLADKLRIASTPTLLTESAVPVRPEPNTVDHPRHYNVGKIEAITVIEDWNLGFNLGNCLKYLARCDHKGNAVEDLKKALWYLQRELDRRNTMAR